MFLVGICEDNFVERKFLQEKVSFWLKKKKMAFQIMTFAAGEELLASKENFHLIFLDIDMGAPRRMDGIEIGRAIRRYNKQAKLIYVTGYDDYQSKALALHCFQYLLKPVDEETIFQQLQEVIEYAEKPVPKVLLKTESGMFAANVADINYFQYFERQRIRVAMRTNECILHSSLTDVCAMMKKHPFYLSHQNYLVNLANVAKVCADKILLASGETLPLAGRRAKMFRETFYEYLFDIVGEGAK